MSKKTFFTFFLQVIVIGVFAFIAIGSGTDGRAVSNQQAASAIRGFGQGLTCGANGFTMVSTESSQNACIRTCERKGYSAYCYGDEGGCFCK